MLTGGSITVASAAVLGLALGLAPAPSLAQGLAEVTSICGSPATDGPRKIEDLAARGWEEIAPGDIAMEEFARLHTPSIGAGLEDWGARLALAPQLAANLTDMVHAGQATLLGRDGAALILIESDTAGGLAHLTCLFGSPESDALDALMAEIGTPEEFEDVGYVVLQVDERVNRVAPPVTFEMSSIWSRLQAPVGELTDGYRLERIEVRND